MSVWSSRRVFAICSSLAIIIVVSFSYQNARIPLARSTLSNVAHIASNVQRLRHDLLEDASNATLGFQKIFIINLASRTDRRDAASLAAALTGLEVEFVDAATHVDPKAWPPGFKEANLNPGGVGAWRSHLNIVEQIVRQNISSALVLEDDADWDIRIKSQMRDFAKASRLLVQPLPGTTNEFLDPTWPQPDVQHEASTDFDIGAAVTGEPSTSPYGDLDRWDMLWVGHCGCRFPWAADKNVPLGRAVIPNDDTVPARKQLNMEFGDSQLLDQYPDYTRVVARSRVNTCTLGYGLSQAGARRILYEAGVHEVSGPIDMVYRSLCDGVDGRELMTCLSPQPALFNHHRPVAPRWTFSDISGSEDPSDPGDQGWNDVPASVNIRWATRVNFDKLLKGATDYIDSYGETSQGE